MSMNPCTHSWSKSFFLLRDNRTLCKSSDETDILVAMEVLIDDDER